MNFDQAAEIVKTRKNLKDETLLRLYGLYKQATDGNCNIKKPGFLDIVGRAKFNAWNSLMGKSANVAKKEYIQLVQEIIETKESTGWVNVSTMKGKIATDDVSEITVFDIVKDGKLEDLKIMKVDFTQTDKNKMTLLHWAADRGHLEIVKYLVMNDINRDAQDVNGNTALHFAKMTENVDIIDYLVQSHCNQQIKNHKGHIYLDY